MFLMLFLQMLGEGTPFEDVRKMALLDGLRSSTFTGTTGYVAFDENGDNVFG